MTRKRHLAIEIHKMVKSIVNILVFSQVIGKKYNLAVIIQIVRLIMVASSAVTSLIKGKNMC